MNPLDPKALDLFDELLDLGETERAQRLAQLEINHPTLAATLKDMLSADAASSGVLDRGVQVMADEVISAAVSEGALKAGDVLGAFDLLRLLGRGGMGEVWLAQRHKDVEGADSFVQQVALKVLKRGMDSEAISARFVQERRILAELNHPHFARFIDGGISAEGRLYFAMEYVDGPNLLDYANANSLSVRDRVRLLAEVGEAVAYAQNRLVVHRDLKPSNILVDGSGAPRILDFGIAKLLDERAPDEGLTHTGMHALSPAYAAPEQILGEPISTATDVFALGTILFELLTGALPHARQVGSLEALAAQVNSEQALAPSRVIQRGDTTYGSNTARLLREISGDLDVIVLTALQREPARRYASAAAFAQDLRRWLEARPISAQADSRTYRFKKFVSRNRLAVGSASTVLLALIAGLSVALWQAGVARQQAARANAQTMLAENAAKASAESAERTRLVKDFMMQTFVAADPMRRPEGAPQTVAAAFDEALKRIDIDVADDPKLQTDLLDDFGEVLANQGRFDEARKLLDRALALAEKNYPANSPVIAETLMNLAVIASNSGRPLDAAKILERAYAILQPHEDDLPEQFATVLSGMTTLRQAQGRPEEAIVFAKKALEITRVQAKPGTGMLAAALHNYATNLLEAGRHDEAEPYQREALLEAEKIGGHNSPMVDNVLITLSAIVYRQGKMAESLQINERRLKIMREAYPGGHPGIADALTDVGREADDLGDVIKARASFDEAIAMFSALKSTRILLPLRYRALMEVGLNNYSAALADFDRGLSVCKQEKMEHILCTVLRTNRSGVLARMGQGTDAMREVDAAIADLARRKMLDQNEYAQALESKAFAFKALGQQAQALTTQQEAITLYSKIFGANHAEVKRAQRNLAKLQAHN
jgi:eukaryotic-like serine/threonine-protein kinase